MTGSLLTLLNAQTLAAYTAAGYWGDETLYAVAARHARSTPNSFAVRDRHRRLTYAALIETADRLAASLAGHGIRPGQRVAVWLPSRIETAIAEGRRVGGQVARDLAEGDRGAARPTAMPHHPVEDVEFLGRGL